MHVLHAATHEHTGAGRSAVRIHRAIARTGSRSEMIVLDGTGANPGVKVLPGALRRRLAGLQLRAENGLLALQESGEPGFRSLALGRGPGLAGIGDSTADIVHLHWIPQLLGVADLPAIGKPVVWTFHDQWPICGAEHYTELERPRLGYLPGNRAPGASGPDLDRWTWRRKREAWKSFAPTIVCSSRWLGAATRASQMFGDREIHVIATPLDTSLYRPQDRGAARARLGLPGDRTLLLFGAWEATRDRRKGFHVLSEALRRLHLRGLAASVDLVLFGAKGEGPVQGFNTHWLGFVEGENNMSRVYSACDALAIPSLQDNYPNVLAEAMACGLPAVGSDTGGIPDLIRHRETGLLAAPGNAEQLAGGLELLLSDAMLRSSLGKAARRAVERDCDEQAIGARYLEIYRAAASR
ncbi:MAG TPA: glycosyltransferase [Burkholderiales bacterium]|nr:glycosyltransferase [Burkholderiales bacterium]